MVRLSHSDHQRAGIGVVAIDQVACTLAGGKGPRRGKGVAAIAQIRKQGKDFFGDRSQRQQRLRAGAEDELVAGGLGHFHAVRQEVLSMDPVFDKG